MAKKTSPKVVKLVFEREKETRRTFRFREAGVDDPLEAVVGSIYVKKTALKELGNPSRIKVRIEPC